MPFNPPPPPPQFTLQYTGFEATVRKYLPENVHVRFACNRFRQPVCETGAAPRARPPLLPLLPHPTPRPFFSPRRAAHPFPPPSSRASPQIVYAVLGTYAVLITVSKLRSGSAKAAALAKQPAPAAPDYHTREWRPATLRNLPPAPASAPPHTHTHSHTYARRAHHAHPPHAHRLPPYATAAIVVSSDIPSFGTPEWEEFINKDGGNFQVWLEAQFKE